MHSFEKIPPGVKGIRRKLTSLTPFHQTQSAYHPRAQRNVFRRRDAREQSRSFAHWN